MILEFHWVFFFCSLKSRKCNKYTRTKLKTHYILFQAGRERDGDSFPGLTWRSGVMNNAALNILNLTERCICKISSISTVFWKRGNIIRKSDCSPSLPPSLTYCLRNANQMDNWLPPTCTLTCISMGIFRQNEIPLNPRVGVMIKSLNVQGLLLLPPAHFIFTA